MSRRIDALRVHRVAVRADSVGVSVVNGEVVMLPEILGLLARDADFGMIDRDATKESR